MKTDKNIDRLFQEKLKDFEVSPPDAVWKNIEHHLKNKDSNRLFPLWLRIGGVAVVGLLLIISGVNYFDNTSNNVNIITNTNKKDLPKINEGKIKLLESIKNNEIIASEINEDTPINKSLKLNVKQKTVINYKNTQEKSNIITAVVNHKNSKLTNFEKITLSKNNNKSFRAKIALNILKKENKTVKITENQGITTNNDKTSKKDIANLKSTENQDNLLKENLPEDLEIKQKKDKKKWSVASLIAPVYYNSFNAKGSPLDSKFENSPKQGSKTVSYGVKIVYKLNDKLSLQSGISIMNVGYKIGDVYINPSHQSAARLANVNYTSTATILNINTSNFINTNLIETTSLSIPVKGVLNQKFGYIEIPFELKYRLRENNRKLGFNLIGGFSTLVLNKNDVFVETSSFSSNLGEANNLNNVNFSGNLGVDVDYKLNKNIFFNIAPMLKIHTSTFSKNDGSFKPYMLGVYTGLNYEF